MEGGTGKVEGKKPGPGPGLSPGPEKSSKKTRPRSLIYVQVYFSFPILCSLFLAAAVAALPSCHPSGETARPPVHLGPEIKRLAEEYLTPLEDPFTLELTLGGEGRRKAQKAEALLEFIGGIAPGATVIRRDLLEDQGADRLGVPHGPVFEMKGRAPGVLRYYGYPERKEIRPFLEGIQAASGQNFEVPQATTSRLKALDGEIRIRIFTTPD